MTSLRKQLYATLALILLLSIGCRISSPGSPSSSKSLSATQLEDKMISDLNQAIPPGTPIREVEVKMRELGFECEKLWSKKREQYLVCKKTESIQIGVAAVWQITVPYVNDISTESKVDLRFIGL